MWRYLLAIIFISGLLITPTRTDSGGFQQTAKRLYRRSHALIIGINDYPKMSGAGTLEFAERDAHDLELLLIGSFGFEPTNTRVLLGSQATKDAIEKELSRLTDKAIVSPDDQILVYFAGHAQSVTRGPGSGSLGYLVPSDANLELNHGIDPEGYNRSCVSMLNVWSILRESPARHSLILADACFSGLLTRSRSTYKESPVVDLLRTARGVLTAGTSDELAQESQELGHGLFSYALTQELRTRSMSKRPFGAFDLYTSVRSAVQSLSKQSQTPQFGMDEGCEGTFYFDPMRVSEAISGTGPESLVKVGYDRPSDDGLARVSLHTNPEGASFKLDSEEYVTPSTIHFSQPLAKVRSYDVVFTLAGYLPKRKHVDFLPGRELQYPQIVLEPILGSKKRYIPTEGRKIDAIAVSDDARLSAVLSRDPNLSSKAKLEVWSLAGVPRQSSIDVNWIRDPANTVIAFGPNTRVLSIVSSNYGGSEAYIVDVEKEYLVDGLSLSDSTVRSKMEYVRNGAGLALSFSATKAYSNVIPDLYNRLYLWDISARAQRTSFEMGECEVRVDPTQRFLVVASPESSRRASAINVVDLQSRNIVRGIGKKGSDQYTHFLFGSGGRELYAWSKRQITCFDFPSGKELRSFAAPVGSLGKVSNEVSDFSLSSSGNYLMAPITQDGLTYVQIWNARTGAPLISARDGAIPRGFSKNEDVFYTSRRSFVDSRVQSWRLVDGAYLGSVAAKSVQVDSSVFRPWSIEEYERGIVLSPPSEQP